MPLVEKSVSEERWVSPSRAVGAAAYNLDWRQNREPMENEAESVCTVVSPCARGLYVCVWCVCICAVGCGYACVCVCGQAET